MTWKQVKRSKGKTFKRLLLSFSLLSLAFISPSNANILGFLPYKACFDSASLYTGVPEKLLIAIAKVESDFNPRAINYNKDGTTDYGIMQINTVNIQDLGLSYSRIYNPCYNIYAGAIVLRQCINQYGFGWRAVSCYNAGHYWNPHYVMKVASALEQLNKVTSLYQYTASLSQSTQYILTKGYNNGKYNKVTPLHNYVINNGYFTIVGEN